MEEEGAVVGRVGEEESGRVGLVLLAKVGVDEDELR